MTEQIKTDQLVLSKVSETDTHKNLESSNKGIRGETTSRPASASGFNRSRPTSAPNIYAKSYTAMEALAEFSCAPGSNAYDQERGFNATTKKAPAFTIARRYQSASSYITPGPGEYNYSRNFSHGASIPKSARPSSVKMSGTPSSVGPGSYMTEKSSIQRKGVSFGFKPVRSMIDVTPAPGDYFTEKRLSQAGRFTLGQGRDAHFQNMYAMQKGGPGVGAYNVGGRLSEQGFHIARKYERQPLNQNPGVGAYNIERKNQQKKGFSFGSRTKSFFFVK